MYPAGDLPHLAGELDAVCDALETRARDRLRGPPAREPRPRADAPRRRVRRRPLRGPRRHRRGRSAGTAPRRRPAAAASVIEANLVGRPLVYVNGCASAHAAAATASVAHAFLHGGALAVVGTVADVADDHAATLATTFYREALGAHRSGTRSARRARRCARPRPTRPRGCRSC